MRCVSSMPTTVGVRGRRLQSGRVRLPDGVLPGGRFDAWSRVPARYVVLDVDGTLLSHALEATAVVAAAVEEARAAGVHVALASGRLPSGVARVAQQLGLDGPNIVLNGAQLRSNGSALATWPLSEAERHALLAFCREHDLYAELYVDDGFWVTRLDERYRLHWEIVTGWPLGTADDVDLDAQPIIKGTVVGFGDAERDFLVVGPGGARADCPASAAWPPMPGAALINVTSPDADKGVALRHAADLLGVPMDAVAAIGDADNDASMLAVAGTAIAMGQAAASLARGGAPRGPRRRRRRCRGGPARPGHLGARLVVTAT